MSKKIEKQDNYIKNVIEKYAICSNYKIGYIIEVLAHLQNTYGDIYKKVVEKY